MDIFNILTMIGGLSLFLYGMHVLGEGLTKLSGGRMQEILAKLSDNPIKGVLLGAGVTAVIQSSSATTVMVVGFVNSGIMQLKQAVGIIMGANVGTTVTSWILSLSGIQSESFFIKILKPTSFSPILALIGVIFLIFCKSEKKHDIGKILIGFAVLMFGMDTMSTAVAPLKDVPEFTRLFTAFSNPIVGMIAGTVLTAAMQSSSASVGILQALCATGAIPYNSVVPIIMGQNIGTCVTALISSAGAKVNAKRAAFIHLYFNIIGTIVFMSLFYFAYAVHPFAFMTQPANASGIAVIHSCFNVLATIVLLPFSNAMLHLAELSVKQTDSEEETVSEYLCGLSLIDDRFLKNPAFALSQCTKAVEKMAGLSVEIYNASADLMNDYSDDKADKVDELESIIDQYEEKLGNYLTKISSFNVSPSEANHISDLQSFIGDFERIADYSQMMKTSFKKLDRKKGKFSEKGNAEIRNMLDTAAEICKSSLACFLNNDKNAAKTVIEMNRRIDKICTGVIKSHKKRLKNGKCSVDMGFILSDLTKDVKSVSEHCKNIADTICRPV
ncbi:MAG: Na/Pi cotransporter family protein [Firmicutes bacterium]|nr:Na/Pi cotransporter family protein [Bacillota bacterium]MBQ9519461.1 Na/Pi cotransporter family protein [Bacillota bacterium]